MKPRTLASFSAMTLFVTFTISSRTFAKRTHDQIITFDAVPNARTNPTSINPRGEITGWYPDASGTHGFVRDRDDMLTFDAIVVTRRNAGCRSHHHYGCRIELLNRSTKHQSYLAARSLDLTMTEPAQFRVRYRRYLHYVRSGSQRHRSYKHRPERLLFLDRFQRDSRFHFRAEAPLLPRFHFCSVSEAAILHLIDWSEFWGAHHQARWPIIMYPFLLGVPRETQRHFSCRHGRNNPAEHYSEARFAFKPNSSQQLIQKAPFYVRSDGNQIEH